MKRSWRTKAKRVEAFWPEQERRERSQVEHSQSKVLRAVSAHAKRQ